MNINDLKVGDVVYIKDDLEFWQVYGSLIYYPKMRTGLARVKYVSTDYFRIHQDGIGYLYTVEMIDWEKTRKLQNNNCYNKEETKKVEYKWVPKQGEKYYWISSYLEIDWYFWEGLSWDHDRLAFNNCFRTIEDAEEKLKKIKEVLKGE